MRKNISLTILQLPSDLVRDQHSEGSGSSATATATTAERENKSGATQNKNAADSNLNILLDFKKALLDEQKIGEQKIKELNDKIDDTKNHIDVERTQLEDFRIKLKEVNDQKDAEYDKFVDLKNSVIEARNQMRTVDAKTGSIAAQKSRKDRYDIANLTKTLEQIERDIQTKKLSKDEERRLVARSKEIATKLHALKLMHRKEDNYRDKSSQYDTLKGKMNRLFDQKSEFGRNIGKLKTNLDNLLNLRESLYEDRRKIIRSVREAGAKLEMVETQLNAIQYRKSRFHASGPKHKRQHDSDISRESRIEAAQERAKRSRENQERWNVLKEAAAKKLSKGEKLSFEEMKLIFGDSNSTE
jgi:uncharacterized coiled-coil DUF342 family protein